MEANNSYPACEIKLLIAFSPFGNEKYLFSIWVSIYSSFSREALLQERFM